MKEKGLWGEFVAELVGTFVLILFGDGAGAAIITGTEDKTKAILDVKTSSDGEYQDFLITEGCGSKYPCSPEVLATKQQFLKIYHLNLELLVTTL